MSRNSATIPAPIKRVFAVLADPRSYAEWVVGAHSIRDADGTWPAVGAKLHHRIGAGPFKLNDNTEVVAVTKPTRLVLHARARPFGTARVELDLLDLGPAGTQVTMVEEPDDRVSRLLHNPLTDAILHRRNTAALARLGKLAGARSTNS
jgi:uncharacterized protein YndB with AHSA1/START domain